MLWSWLIKFIFFDSNYHVIYTSMESEEEEITSNKKKWDRVGLSKVVN